MGFGVKSGISEPQVSTVKEFKRDLSDNSMFKNIQVDDLSTITDENTRWKLDGDGIVWKACSSQETLYIVAKHLTEDVSVELKGITEFKGGGKAISDNSW